VNGLVWLFILAVALLLPAVLVLFSPKVHGWEKIAWTLVSVVFSWMGFVVFLIVIGLRPIAASQG
jgi:hypothetical protein